MRYNLLFMSGDSRLSERLKTALAAECAVMQADPRQEDNQALVTRMDPDGIVVDAGAHTGAKTMLESIAAIREKFSGLPLIVIGDEMSAQMILASFRAGADDFLDRDSPDAEINASILSRLRGRATQRSDQKAAIRFDILSPGSAEEDYDLALNLAAMLASGDRARRVLFLDLSLPASSVRLALNVEPSLTIPDAIREMRRLDRAFFESALGRSSETGLYVLPLADDAIDMTELPSLHDLSILMQILRTMFDAVIVHWGLFSRQAAQAGVDGGRRQVLLCCNQRFSSVRHAKSLLEALTAGGTHIQDIVLAVHQLAAGITPSPDDIVRAVGAERSLQLRTSWSVLVTAHNQGRPLCLQGPSPYVTTLRTYLATEGFLSEAEEPPASHLFGWLRRVTAS